MKFKLLLLLSIPILVVLVAGLGYYYSIKVWKYDGPTVFFDIKPGESFSSVNDRLAKKGMISSAKTFYRYCKINGFVTKFQAGRYQIETNSNMLDIIETFVKGNSITIAVTIPEGKNIFEIADILHHKSIIISKTEFIEFCKNPALAKKLGIHGYRLEGYLYPETYRFTPNSSPITVIKTMVNMFHQKTAQIDFTNQLNLNQHQVIILASIVEKETGASAERAIIAGVFINRLQRKMRLQSDPTTIYGIFENFDGNLRKKHLLQKNSYNTYKINGLPIGPIANPGLQSIMAVLRPQQHNYLYFVSQNNGTHIFSKTYKQHLLVVDKYQKNIKMRRGKSWRDLRKKAVRPRRKLDPSP